MWINVKDKDTGEEGTVMVVDLNAIVHAPEGAGMIAYFSSDNGDLKPRHIKKGALEFVSFEGGS